MKKYCWRSCSVLLGSALTLATLIPAIAQEVKPLRPEQVDAIRAAVARPNSVTYLLVKEDFTGDFESIKTNIDKFMINFREQKLDAAVKNTSPKALLIYRESPEQKKQFAYSVGLTVPGKVTVSAPLSIERLDFTSAVNVTNKGPDYQELGGIFREIANLQAKKAVNQQAKFPVVLELLNDPARTATDQVLTRLVVPVGGVHIE